MQIGKKKNLNSDDDFDARADDTAYASTVAITLGAACSPDGYEIVREYPLPDVTTKEDLNQLIGQKILLYMHGMMTQLMVGILAQFATLDLV